jgi:hypothetical protein
MHRRALVGLGLALVVLVAGCGGGGGGGDAPSGPPLTGAATAAELADGTRSEAGFVETGRATGRLNTTVSATIQGDVELRTTRRVNVTTASVSYRREREGGDPTAFGTYSVPAVEPFERADLSKNPADGLAAAELADRAQDVYAVTGTTAAGTTTLTLLGNETRATRYEATGTRDGRETTVVVTVATVRHGSDYVTAVLVVPAADRDRVSAAALFDGVTH